MELVLERYITQTEGLRGGKAHLANTRITVSDIVIWHFHLGQSLEEIAVTYDIPLAGIHAALSYYFDHKLEVDTQIAEAKNRYEVMKETVSSPLTEKLKILADG